MQTSSETNIEGLRWMPNGQSALSGPLLDLYQRLDRRFLAWAQQFGAGEHLFPTFISAAELDKLDYFRSFPHLVTFPVALDEDADNLDSFMHGSPVDEHGCVQLTKTAAIKNVLTPAACYHFYIHLQNAQVDRAAFFTTRATCFRNEKEYLPLQRQWSFSMREVVCIGSAAEVEQFIASFKELLREFFAAIKLPVSFEPATDPFFRPAKNPKFIMQKLDPVKTEMIFDGLAIGSFNFHRSYFGETFNITRDGQPLSSACVAFGVERWLHAFAKTYGSSYPQL